jgi:hypothetical protein
MGCASAGRVNAAAKLGGLGMGVPGTVYLILIQARE